MSRIRCRLFFPSVVLLAVLLSLARHRDAQAHPMGNFAICHYTRLQASPDGLQIRYILDFAEIPTLAEQGLLDTDGDGALSPREKAAYVRLKASELLGGFVLLVDDKPVSLEQVKGDVQLAPGAGGLATIRLELDFRAAAPLADTPHVLVFRDRNYESRAGWKEMVAVAGPGVTLRHSSVPTADQSRELTAYPPDAIPPQVTEARFTVFPGGHGDTGAPETASTTGAAPTPRDAFTEAIARRDLGPAMILSGLAIAFAFGALHGLSPGHGKAMVAAYLVGARGTAGHAAFLGVVVTVTHTLGVFALGLATLLASRYVVPERLYPILSILSGLAILAVGLRLLYLRVRRLLRGPSKPTNAVHGHEHLADGPVSARALLALGISGGLVPCPSALVVLLAAVALHRIAYGLLLITAFSMGLAAVLVAIGLLVVYARRWLDGFSVSAAVLRRIPVASAAVITLIGAALVVRGLGEGMP